MTKNAMSRNYRDSYLGIVWTLIQPAIQVSIYSVIMPHIMRFPVANYTLYLVTSILTWTFISQTLLASTNALLNNAETIKRCIVSKTVFPLTEVSRLLYNYLVGLVFMICLFMLIGIAKPCLAMLALPLYIFVLYILLGAIAIALSFVAPYIKDLSEIINVGINISFWLTPIVYPVTAVPERFHTLYEFNPFYIMLRPISTIIYEQKLPGLYQTWTLLCLLLITTLISYLIYRVCRKNFIFYL